MTTDVPLGTTCISLSPACFGVVGPLLEVSNDKARLVVASKQMIHPVEVICSCSQVCVFNQFTENEIMECVRVPADQGEKLGEFVYDSSDQFNGIIAHLTRESGGIVVDKGIVDVTASSSGRQARRAVELELNSKFLSENKPNQWICYDFKERRVIPTSYSLCSYGTNSDCPKAGNYRDLLKSWVIEVSNDRSSWTEIDRRDNNNDLNDKFACQNFSVSKVPSEGFRFFRLKQTGPNHRGGNALSISAMEIFGTLCKK